eukprot:2982341-Prymnesium_polylepis.1
MRLFAAPRHALRRWPWRRARAASSSAARSLRLTVRCRPRRRSSTRSAPRAKPADATLPSPPCNWQRASRLLWTRSRRVSPMRRQQEAGSRRDARAVA